MTLPTKVYEFLKWMIVIFLPALSLAVLALVEPFPSFTCAGTISKCIAILQTFLGSIFLISSSNYYASISSTGTISITEAANVNTETTE